MKDFLRKVGGVVEEERVYDFTDFLHVFGTLNKNFEGEPNPQGLDFKKSHKKQESIKNKLHQEMIENIGILSQYDSISTDDKIIESLKIGLKDAQDILSTLGMQPKNNTQSFWWVKPWIEDWNYPTFQIMDEVFDDSPPKL